MYVVVFEVWPAEGRTQDYFDLAAEMKNDLEKVDGFISVERFESVTALQAIVIVVRHRSKQRWDKRAQTRTPPRRDSSMNR